MKKSVDTIPDINIAQPVQIVNNRKQWLFTTIKCVFSATLIYWILRSTNLSEIFTSMRFANFPLILAAFCLYSASYYLRAHRWWLLLNSQGVDVSIPFLIKSYMVSIFFSNFLPSTIGADAVRAYDSWQAGTSKVDAVAVIFMDRFLGMLALVLFVIVGLLIPNKIVPSLPSLSLWIILTAAGILLIACMIFVPLRLISAMNLKIKRIFPKKIRGVLEKMLGAYKSFGNQKRVLARALRLSLIFQTSVVVHYYLIARALDFPVPFHYFFLIVPIAIFIMMLPVSINAIGVREHVFIFFFTALNVPKSDVVAFAWLSYGIVVFLGIIGGFVYIFRR